MLVTLAFASACNEAIVRVNEESTELCSHDLADGLGAGVQLEQHGVTQIDPPPVEALLLHSHDGGQVRGSDKEPPELNQADGLGAGVQVEQVGGTQLGPPPVEAPLLHNHEGSQVRGSE